MKIIAHRGASFVAPENTISAFHQAWVENADGIELDIRLTSDNKIVVIHDAHTKRISNSSLTVKESSSNSLQNLDVGSWKGAQFKHERIPLLETVLDQLPNNKSVYIEIKTGLSILPELKSLILKFSQLKSNMIFISFSYDLIAALKAALPDHQCLWIVEFGNNVPSFSKNARNDVINKIKSAHLDGISSCSNLQHCQELAPDIKRNRWLWNVWTVDNPNTARQMKNYGVHSLSTNRPEWIRNKIK